MKTQGYIVLWRGFPQGEGVPDRQPKKYQRTLYTRAAAQVFATRRRAETAIRRSQRYWGEQFGRPHGQGYEIVRVAR